MFKFESDLKFLTDIEVYRTIQKVERGEMGQEEALNYLKERAQVSLVLTDILEEKGSE